jgi:hypothetical protein
MKINKLKLKQFNIIINLSKLIKICNFNFKYLKEILSINIKLNVKKQIIKTI